MTTELKKKNVSGIDEQLWYQMKAQAALEHKTLTQWLQEAVREKLARAGATHQAGHPGA